MNPDLLRNLAQKYGTPFYAYEQSLIEDHFERLQNAFSSKNLKVALHYSVKANSNLHILKLLHAIGSCFDVVSGGELERCLRAGARGSEIVFAGVGKSSTEIDQALRAEILQFNVESEDELKRIAERAAQLQCKAAVALRINPDVDAKTHAYITTGTYTSKFGISVPEALRIYKEWSTHPHIEWVGLDMHIGSQLTEEEPIRQSLRHYVSFVQELIKLKIRIRNLDFGGGLGIAYKDETVISPERFSELVAEAFRPLDLSQFHLIMEPGRYLVAESGVLVSEVQYIKDLGSKCYVITDAGMTELMRPTLYGAHHEVQLIPQEEGRSAERPLRTVDVVGPICESSDFFAKDRSMPLPRAGDLLALKNCGAYAASMSHTYNTRPRAPEFLIRSPDQIQTIRRRENIEDLLRLEIEI